MTAIDRITTSPDVCGGRPCIRGLRIRVKDVLDLLAAGATAATSLIVAALDYGETLVESA